jgi:hypothetical protein
MTCRALTPEEAQRLETLAAAVRPTKVILYIGAFICVSLTVAFLLWFKHVVIAFVYAAIGYMALASLFLSDSIFGGCGGPGLETRFVVYGLIASFSGLALSAIWSLKRAPNSSLRITP